MLAVAAIYSAAAGLEVTMSAFRAGALQERCLAWVRWTEVVYRGLPSVYAAASSTAATHGAVVATVEVD
jgi:hypothetical protein